MGKVKRLLASTKVKPLAESYCGIELCETVHFHMPGFRFELDAQQFQAFAELMQKALAKWMALGQPLTAEFEVLAGGYLPGLPVYADRFDVEEQVVPTIHIHLRGLSIRSSIHDFVMFANVVEEAKHNLTK